MEYDSPTSLYHTYARYYSPGLQRFLSEDPLQFGGGDVNLFGYAGNDPVGHKDPLGLYLGPVGVVPPGSSITSPMDNGIGGYIATGSPAGGYENVDPESGLPVDPAITPGPEGAGTISIGGSALNPAGVISIGGGSTGTIGPISGAPAGLQLAQAASVGAAGVPQSQIPYTQSRCPCGCSACGTRRMLVTGYSNDYESTGKNSGDPGYGVTSSGTKAGPGTIATPSRYPYGTHMYVPGYGCGSVEDRGGAIRRNHIDLWFPTPQEAHEWGNPRLPVAVCH